MDEIDLHLGRRLRRRRKLMGLTQQALAAACGVRFQQIQKYECAANRMSAGRIWQLSQALAAPVGYFFEGLTPALETGHGGPGGAAETMALPETRELIRAYYALDERPRRRLLELAKAMTQAAGR